MSHTILLNSDYKRRVAHGLVERAPEGFIVSIREARRTNAQNDKMWAMLEDISLQKPQDLMFTPDEWKSRFMHACGWEQQFLPGLDGRPFPVGFRSSRMTKAQMSTLIDFMQAWGDENGVRWSDVELKQE